MKNISLIFLTLILFSLTHAQNVDGYTVYKKYCSSCHLDKISMEKMKKIEKMVKAGKNPPLKAPPFPEVSARIKYFYPDKKEFIKFVVDYITNPSPEKSKCLPMALKKLGLMPPIGKSMSEKEKKAVAAWLYENYNTKWEDMPMGRRKMHQKEKKCLQKE